jgi:hypothetical protein
MRPTPRVPAVLLAIALALGSAACGSGQQRKNEVSAESYLPMLQRELRNDEPTVRRSAARGLGRIGPAAKEAVPALICATTDTDPQVRRAAALALVLIQAPGASAKSHPAGLFVFPEIGGNDRAR